MDGGRVIEIEGTSNRGERGLWITKRYNTIQPTTVFDGVGRRHFLELPGYDDIKRWVTDSSEIAAAIAELRALDDPLDNPRQFP